MEPPGYKLVMNKFRLKMRKFLIIRGIKFWELSDRRRSEPGTSVAPHRAVGERRGGILKTWNTLLVHTPTGCFASSPNDTKQ